MAQQAIILPVRSALRVVSPAQLDAQTREADAAFARAREPVPADMTDLAAFIRREFDTFKNHRNSANGWNERLMAALRAFNGVYDSTKIAEIAKFGGSKVYAKIVAMKCRGASSLLRDVYLAPDRPWGIAPPADPDIPPNILQSIQVLVASEADSLAQAGQNVDATIIRDRVMQLMEAARVAAKNNAEKKCRIAEDRIDELLSEGGFYKALAEFIVDLPLFPFACVKGPVVRIVPSVDWSEQGPVISQKPRLFWNRISPFDVWWTPGVADIEDAAVIERSRLTRADLNDLLDLPGYNHDAVRTILDEYGRGGLHDDWDSTDAERAVQERRENPHFNQSGLISCLEYHGNIQGRLLLGYGLPADQVPDPLRDYMVQAWLIGRYVIKVQLSPSPRKRHPYYITSFEKVPGTPVGNGLPDILSDIAEVCNATLRSLVNNLSIASGPQVVVNVDRLAQGEDAEELFPWKRWHVQGDPMGNNSQPPISFFMPTSNANDLMMVYEKFSGIADELSAIPKYLTGSGTSGGAGRTASGLAMLMGNASKVLQTVAANIDRDVLEGLLTGLYDMLMLTDKTGILSGQESIRVLGVNVAVQRETQRSRQLEFLQISANPLDAQIVGMKGRAAVLRSVAQTIGLDGEKIVPTEEQLEMKEKQQQQAALQQLGAQAQGKQAGDLSTNDMGPRTNSFQAKPSGGVG